MRTSAATAAVRRAIIIRITARATPAVPEMLQTGECGDAEGVLEVLPDG